MKEGEGGWGGYKSIYTGWYREGVTEPGALLKPCSSKGNILPTKIGNWNFLGE